jgi:cytochrome c-type biogenesis protein CcmH
MTALVALAAPITSSAQGQPDSASIAARDPRFEEKVREVASTLRCPVCQNNSIEESPSLLAQDMKREVRERLAQGQSPDEIRQYFISRYGEWVLTKPRAAGINLSVWLLPVLALVGGGVVVWSAVRRWVRQGGASRGDQAHANPAASVVELRARRAALQASLKELEAEFAAGRLTAADLALLKERDEAELAPINDALKQHKKDAPDTLKPVLPQRAAGASGGWSARIAWAIGLAAFALILVVSLRGSVGARSEGGVITGTQTASAAPLDMELQQTGPLDSLRIAQLEARVRRDSTDVPALIELGHLYLSQRLIEQAILVDTLAIRLQPDAAGTAEAFAHLGMILWGMGQTQGALQALDKALFLHPDLPEALMYRGIIYFAGVQDMRSAAASFERYLAVAPPDANTARIRAMLAAAQQGTTSP